MLEEEWLEQAKLEKARLEKAKLARSGEANVVQAYRDRIAAIYSHHNPGKLCVVDSLMAKCKGQEHVNYMRICEKYKVQPEPEIKPAAPEPAAPLPGCCPGVLLGGAADLGMSIKGPTVFDTKKQQQEKKGGKHARS